MMATSSQGSSEVPTRGSQEPTKLVVPDFATSDWKKCHDINAAGGIELLEWQDGILRGWLGKNALGRWAANTCGGSIARQNGKSLGLVVPRVNYGMLQLNEEVLYTSHLQKTSTETFESVAAFFDQPALRKHVKDIKTALGREQVILKRGGRVKFLARTRNGGRGQHGDLLIFDESLELSVDSQSSFLPAISASRNPQVIYVSSPPTATSDSDVFRDIRARALNGLSNRIAWFEWSVDAESAEEINVNDKALWYMTNPSLGILIQETTVEGEVEQMPHDTFARERLGWWSPTAGQMSHPIDAKLWESLVTDNPPQDGKTAYGVKFSIDGSEVCVCAALLHDGIVHVEEVERRNMGAGTAWLAEWIAARKSTGCVCVIDGKAGAQALVDRLGRMPVHYIHVANLNDMYSAASTLVSCVNEQALTWYAPQDDLRDSATTSIRRPIGRDGGWGFGGANPIPIEAAALAVWGVKTSKRDPRRKGLVG